MRVYLPSTLPVLSARVDRDATGAATDPRAAVAEPGSTAYGVTPALREWYREGDLEELEYVALSHAARASLRLLADERPARRVVLAADIPDQDVVPVPDVDVAAVVVSSAVRLDTLAALHVDDLGAADDVAAAAAAVDGADAGDGDAQFIVDSVDDHELQWYAVQEIGGLLG